MLESKYEVTEIVFLEKKKKKKKEHLQCIESTKLWQELASVAQWDVRLTGDQEVMGLIPGEGWGCLATFFCGD